MCCNGLSVFCKGLSVCCSLTNTSQEEEAVSCLEQALEIDPRQEEARSTLHRLRSLLSRVSAHWFSLSTVTSAFLDLLQSQGFSLAHSEKYYNFVDFYFLQISGG